MHALSKAIKLCDGTTGLARKIGEKPQTVNAWLQRGLKRGLIKVPAEHCPSIEEATAHQVTCEQLRPDVKWAVLRGHPLPLSANDGGTSERAA